MTQLGQPWMVLRVILAVGAVVALGVLLAEDSRPLSAGAMIGLGLIGLLVLSTFVYNLRIAAAERLLDDEAGGEEVHARAVGVLVPSWYWNGRNGAVVAVTATSLLVVSVTMQRPRVLARAAVGECALETQPRRFTATLDIETPEGRIAFRTAPSMAADVVQADRFQETPA